MKALIEKYVKRLDAFNRRERIMVFGAAAVAILALFYLPGIAPALDRSRLMRAQILDQKNQIAAATTQMTKALSIRLNSMTTLSLPKRSLAQATRITIRKK